MWHPPEIETKRLLIRELRESDKEDIFEYAVKPVISAFTLWEPHQSIEDSIDYIKNYTQVTYSDGAPEPFGVVHKESGKLIGCTGCFWLKKKNKAMELAYVLNDDYWGNGYIVEASKAAIDFCFKLYGLERMQCRCKADNAASFRVMEKLGMTYEGTLRNDLYHRERYWDMKYCSLLSSEWEKSKGDEPYIRRARFGDEEGIHTSHMRSIQEICSKDYTPEQIGAWGDREYNYEGKRNLIANHHVWVAVKNNKIEGYGLLFDEGNKNIEIGGLYLTPEVCGQGLGKEIVFYMKELSKILGKSKMILSSTVTSKKFYEAQGFVQKGEDDSTMIGGVPVEGHPMELTFD